MNVTTIIVNGIAAAAVIAALIKDRKKAAAGIKGGFIGLLFLFSWSCIKLPQELAELRFMGYEFMLVRLGATIVLTVPAALLLERLLTGKKT